MDIQKLLFPDSHRADGVSHLKPDGTTRYAALQKRREGLIDQTAENQIIEVDQEPAATKIIPIEIANVKLVSAAFDEHQALKKEGPVRKPSALGQYLEHLAAPKKPKPRDFGYDAATEDSNAAAQDWNLR